MNSWYVGEAYSFDALMASGLKLRLQSFCSFLYYSHVCVGFYMGSSSSFNLPNIPIGQPYVNFCPFARFSNVAVGISAHSSTRALVSQALDGNQEGSWCSSSFRKGFSVDRSSVQGHVS